jgi:hypothetical protein
VAVSQELSRIQNALKRTTSAPSLPISPTPDSFTLAGHHPPASQLAPVPARKGNGVSADSWTKTLCLPHTLNDRRLLFNTRECVIVLGDRTGIEKDVLEDMSLAMAFYLQQYGVIGYKEEDRLKVTDVVKELLVNNEIRLEAALLDFRVFDPASKKELLRKLEVKTNYKASDVFFCGHGFDDGCFGIRDGDRVSGSELAIAVQHRQQVTLYFNCCYAERLALSACAGIDKESRKQSTSVTSIDDGWKCRETTTRSWLKTFDRVKGMMMQFLKLAEADATVAEAMAAIDLLNENSFDQNPTCVARSNVVRSNNLMAPPANKKKTSSLTRPAKSRKLRRMHGLIRPLHHPSSRRRRQEGSTPAALPTCSHLPRKSWPTSASSCPRDLSCAPSVWTALPLLAYCRASLRNAMTAPWMSP